LQLTPLHVHGVASEALQFELMELGSMRLFDRARRAWPSEFKLQDDATKVKNSITQGQKTSLILSLKRFDKS
jgi:plasmid replication initiation protein